MAKQQVNQPLPSGYMLEGYRIDRQLSLGGFSVVYLAHDANGTPVAIKEYLPSGLALRASGSVLPTIADEHLAAFRQGMKCFFEEGRALAHLKHPNLVRVLNFFRANETVYLVMQYERGRTLQEHIQKHKGRLTESFLRTVFSRLMNGLREVHSRKLLHLDIKPANIYLRNDGTPVLLDFGAARQTLARDSSLLKPMYTPGFAAPEQFHGREDALGPWTDIYAIGASMYACFAAAAPQSADQRLAGDRLNPAAKRWAGRYSPQLLETIDRCLHLDPKARPQSILELQRALAASPQTNFCSACLGSLRQRFANLISL